MFASGEFSFRPDIFFAFGEFSVGPDITMNNITVFFVRLRPCPDYFSFGPDSIITT